MMKIRRVLCSAEIIARSIRPSTADGAGYLDIMVVWLVDGHFVFKTDLIYAFLTSLLPSLTHSIPFFSRQLS